MTADTRLFEFSKSASEATSQTEIWRALKKSLHSYGVKFVNYAYGEPDDLVMFSNMSSQWLAYYFDHYARTDFITDHCSKKDKPLFVDATYFNGETNLDQTNKLMMTDIRDLGLRSAIGIPIPKPDSTYLAGAGLLFDLGEKDCHDVLHRHGEEMSLLVNTMHRFIADHELQGNDDLYFARHGKDQNRKDILTTREKDVLRFLAVGLRPDRIAEKMDLQIPTIHMHIQKARRRLGASTREQAIATALCRRHLVL